MRAEPVLDAVGADRRIVRRVQEWGRFKALQSGAPVDRETLAAATGWLQRKVVEEASSAAVLAGEHIAAGALITPLTIEESDRLGHLLKG